MVFAKKQKALAKLYFPKNLRFITERPFWVGLLVCLALSLIALLSLLLVFHVRDWMKLQRKRDQLMSNMKLWEGISQKYPTYRDAYFEEALFAYQLGEKQKAWDLVDQALRIDPNFAQGKAFKIFLEKGK